jgi:hypothetical protein
MAFNNNKVFLLILCSLFYCSFVRAQDPGLHVNIALWTRTRCAWFSWQGVQEYKPKLELEYTNNGQKFTRIYQHGLNGQTQPQSFYVHESNTWESKPPATDGTREGHRHNMSAKGGPVRRAFFKCDISEVPLTATITKTILWHHIHSQEGLKLGSVGPGHYCVWSELDIIAQKDREVDLARQGYHKNGNRDYPLDITEYVQLLQTERLEKMAVTGIGPVHSSDAGIILIVSPNPFSTSVDISVRRTSHVAQHEVRLEVFNIAGKMLASIKPRATSDERRVTNYAWSALGHPNGIYIVKVKVGNTQITKKILLQR